MKKKTPKEKPVPTCAYCSKPVLPGHDGGLVRIPTTISGLPETDVMLHSHCLNAYIAMTEANRRPLKANTTFERASGDKPARRIG